MIRVVAILAIKDFAKYKKLKWRENYERKGKMEYRRIGL